MAVGLGRLAAALIRACHCCAWIAKGPHSNSQKFERGSKAGCGQKTDLLQQHMRYNLAWWRVPGERHTDPTGCFEFFLRGLLIENCINQLYCLVSYYKFSGYKNSIGPQLPPQYLTRFTKACCLVMHHLGGECRGHRPPVFCRLPA
jgi:hypothetical protein